MPENDTEAAAYCSQTHTSSIDGQATHSHLPKHIAIHRKPMDGVGGFATQPRKVSRKKVLNQ
jgi:hypothetical protein